uniref:Aquaporin n=1 Tax=Tetranychus urticae TaxID=32264 RepID=T1KPH0_TETUR
MVPQREFGTLSSESFLISLVERIDKLLLHDGFRTKKMSQEVKSLEFWRSLIAECLSTFFYVFLVCAVNISWTGSLIGHTPNWIVMSLTSGLAMAILTQCFGHISGSHVNPAVTCAFLVTRNITPLRSILYIIAQSGGAIAGAALLYGVSIPGHQGALGIALAHEALGAGQIFGVEFVLTFLIVFTIFATLDINRKSMGNDSITIGSAYMVCSLTGLPASGASFNPARALGPAFVMNKWKHHWVYWIAPITGSMLAGLIYEFIFDSRKSKTLRDVIDDIDKDCNDDHYDEPEVKMTNKTIMGFPLSDYLNTQPRV